MSKRNNMVLEDITNNTMENEITKKFKYKIVYDNEENNENNNITVHNKSNIIEEDDDELANFYDELTKEINEKIYELNKETNSNTPNVEDFLSLDIFISIFPYRLFFDYNYRENIYYCLNISNIEINIFEQYLDYYLEIIIHSNFNKFLRKVYSKYSILFKNENSIFDYIFSENRHFLYNITDEYENYFVEGNKIDNKYIINNSLEDVD